MSERDRQDLEIEIEVNGKAIRLPREALEEGRCDLGLSTGIYVGIGDYTSSVQAFLEALSDLGVNSIEFENSTRCPAPPGIGTRTRNKPLTR